MFAIVELEEFVRIPPNKFNENPNDVALEQLKEIYEGKISEELGYIILVIDAKVDPVGYLVARDGASYHKVNCRLLTFYPRLQEVVEGEVIEILEFGSFVRIGPIDGFLHISQIMDEFISYDEKHSMLLGKKTGRKLTIGDKVRAKIVAISFEKEGKIGLTTRQPFLGKIEWIKEETKGEEKEEKKEEK
ncbi:MAG: DNA-directed RNA polymerase [Nitrososphaerota archaeon]